MFKDLKTRIKELFEAQVHLGHKKNKIHPKSKKYIHSINQGVSIINLEKTIELLDKAKEFLRDLNQKNKKVLFVGTKKSTSSIISKFCNDHNIPFISYKWPAGLITNFETIKKNIKKLRQLRKEKEEGLWEKFLKHEKLKLEKQLRKLEKFYGGIADLENMPDALFIVDIRKEKNALKEAIDRKIPVLAITDTNVNPDQVDFPIPGNDDLSSSVESILKEIFEVYQNNKKD